MGEQRIDGNRNVQIQGAVGSRIQITFEGTTSTVPLESAYVPVARKLRSPARLIRAHAGVIPYVERGGLIEELEAWVDSPVPFSGQVVSGRGGAGKTRLAVELCQRLEESHWLCGFLMRVADQGMLDSLVEVPTPRLVVIDYAETRPEQLELLLPLLSAKATPDSPVRVLLLVRGDAGGEGGWAGHLADRVDALDAVLDECEVRQLEDTSFDVDERLALFEAAVPALVERLDPQSEPADPPDLSQEAFASPLMVAIAACLVALGEDAPATREALLDEVLAHERRYWREGAEELGADDTLLERLVALATLLGADDEEQAEGHLALLRYLKDASAERRNRLARWVRAQYPGPRWWNPLEPDLVGEHLVAKCFTEQPEVLSSVLASEEPGEILRPLEVLGRAAVDHSRLAEVLAPILSEELVRLCQVAVVQAEAVRGVDLLYGKAVTVAGAVNTLLQAVEVDTEVLAVAGNLMPPRHDLVLNELAATLTMMYIERLRVLSDVNTVDHAFSLATALNNLSNRLANAGRHADALQAIEEAVKWRRTLAENDPSYLPELAGSLNNLSNRLADTGQHDEALTAIEEAVQLRRSLNDAASAAEDAGLATVLSNLSNRLSDVGREAEAVVAIEEAVELGRQLAASDPSYAPDLAGSLNNLSVHLAAVERHSAALEAIEEAVKIQRFVADANPAAYAPYLAGCLNNLSNRLAMVGRHPEALEAVEESVAIFHPLAKASPDAYSADLIRGLKNLARRQQEIEESE